jgi:hypothetical protein
MPAITRNQMKNAQNANSDNVPVVNLVKDVVPIRQCARKGLDPQNISLLNQTFITHFPQRTPEEIAFINEIKDLLAQCQIVQCKQNKVEIIIKIYKILNDKLTTFLAQNPSNWNKLAFTVYNKAVEFEDQYKSGNLNVNVDQSMVIEFVSEINKSISFLEKYLGSIKVAPTREFIELAAFPGFKTAMDNIAKRNREKWMKPTSRPRRNIPRVDYSGMDMNSDDEGTVSVSKTKWNNGVPTHSWVKYPASQANEIGDEEYSCEY